MTSDFGSVQGLIWGEKRVRDQQVLVSTLDKFFAGRSHMTKFQVMQICIKRFHDLGFWISSRTYLGRKKGARPIDV